MLTLIWVLLWLIGIALALVLLALATPIHIALSAEVGPASRFSLRLRLRLFGGATPQFRVLDTSRRAKARATGPDISEAPAAKRSSRARRKGRTGDWRLPEGATGRLLRALPDFLRREIRRIRVDLLSIEGDIGLGDPADTGRLFGYLMPLNHALRLPRTRIDLRPDFGQLRFEGRADAELRLVPLSMLVPAAQLGWRVFVGRK